ncbi:MAG: hypothetical protein N3F63_00005, partial [Thermoplasmata archaeon]|nr:hypothetical protein [Thermoplasmata archaeon]
LRYFDELSPEGKYLIMAIGIAEKGDIGIVESNELIDIADEYANGGLKVLYSWYNEPPGKNAFIPLFEEKVRELYKNILKTINEGEKT